MNPFCFALMPFGSKKDETGRTIDFDQVYAQIIDPAVRDADLEPVRADQEAVGGIIHKAMFERLMLCEYAVADLTTANPNVFYELGIRHGIRPRSTALIFGKGMRLPFDVAPLRALPYEVANNGLPAQAARNKQELSELLRKCREPSDDSPLYQLVADLPRPDIARLKTDVFREVVEYSRKYKLKLATARKDGASAVAAVEKELGKLDDVDPAIVVDLFLAYRDVKDYAAMVALVDRMSPILARTVLVREQLGLALNRLRRRSDAERVLTELIAERGPSSETNGILGRVYKDQWSEARDKGQQAAAKGYLRKAIETYLGGFEADWRDAYPGINAVTLMEMADPVDPRQAEILPVVRYSLSRRLASKSADYWDQATKLELAVLASDEPIAQQTLQDIAAMSSERWQRESTAKNLRMIRDRRQTKGRDVSWITAIIDELEGI